jgi:hypothetical protein
MNVSESPKQSLQTIQALKLIPRRCEVNVRMEFYKKEDVVGFKTEVVGIKAERMEVSFY